MNKDTLDEEVIIMEIGVAVVMPIEEVNMTFLTATHVDNKVVEVATMVATMIAEVVIIISPLLYQLILTRTTK